MLKLFDLVISPYDSLKVAMQRMTANKRGILFVCDDKLHLIGVITDGDVRRALIKDVLTIAPISKAMTTDPVLASDAKQAFLLAKKYSVIAVPLVSQDGQLIGVAIDGIVLQPEQPLVMSEVPNNSLRAIAIIPARGASKRIPHKNLAVVGGRSLLSWAIGSAQSAQHIDRIIVSTDDPAIANAAQGQGVEIPWMRPTELAQDHSSSFDVVLHAVEWAANTYVPPVEYGVLLEPTAPLRLSKHIDQALELLANSDADSVVSVSEVPHTLNPEEVVVIEDDLLRPYLPDRTMDSRRLRGEQRPVYIQNGIVYAFRISTVLEEHSLYGQRVLPFRMNWYDFLDIDLPQDLPIADLRLRHQTQSIGGE